MRRRRVHLPGKQSRAHEVYEHLRTQIMAGDLEPGTRLVEEQIAEHTSVSRTPVREALRRLEADGLVRITARGVIVAEQTVDQLADICAVRETLEGMASRLAALSRSELDLITLEQLIEESELAAAQGDIARFVALNISFHDTIWQAARNHYLLDQLRTLRSRIHQLQDTTLASEKRFAEALVEHRQMLDALTRQDAGTAGRITEEHVRKGVAIRLARLRIRMP
jgi:DNA-binding GntR family transcriptional regulator